MSKCIDAGMGDRVCRTDSRSVSLQRQIAAGVTVLFGSLYKNICICISARIIVDARVRVQFDFIVK